MDKALLGKMCTTFLIDDRLKSIVGQLHVECKMSYLLNAQLLRCLHLVQSNKSLYDLAPVLNILIGYLID
jgi:hypothetical protein